MHEHDPDLVAALAEDRLAPRQRSVAEAEISACPECRSSMLAQRNALTILRAAPPPALTMTESGALRRSVASALGLAAAPAPRHRRWVPWAGIATAAAVLVAVVVAGPLLDSLSTHDDAAGTFEAAVTTAAAAAEMAPEQLTDAGAKDVPSTLADLSAAGPDLYSDITRDDLARWRDWLAGAEIAGDGFYRRLGEATETAFGAEFGAERPIPSEVPTPCMDALIGAVPRAGFAVPLVTGTFEGSTATVFAVFTGDQDPPAIVVATSGMDDCRVLAAVEG